MKVPSVAALFCLFLACSDPVDPSVLAGYRSTILISVDTLRADHLGVYGYERDTTPNLSRFFAKGTLFERGTSSAPCTTPSVAQFITGSFTPDLETPRLAERLRSQGVRTAAFTNQSRFSDEGMGIALGFDTYENSPSRGRITSQLTDHSIEWLRENHDKGPLFLWVHYFTPHDPYNPPDRFRVFDDFPTNYEDGDRDRILKTYQGKNETFVDSPETEHLVFQRKWKSQGQVFDETEIDNFVALYDGEILYADYEIGRLLDELDDLGLTERSLVFMTSDHGEWLGESHLWDHCMSLHQREIHVPLLMRAGDRDHSKKTRVTHPVSTLDIAPTVLDWQGIDQGNSKLIGTSLIGEESHPGVVAFWHDQMIVMDENWKLYYADGPVALFDLSQDPFEKNNLLEFEPHRAEEMSRTAEAHNALGKKMNTESEQIIERLKAIGYLN